MIRGDVAALNHLAFSLKDAIVKMEQYYNNKDEENLSKIKGEIMRIQKKIDSLLK